MALFFILSLFVYPRFLHIFNFPLVTSARMTFQNEFAHLATFVLEAVNYYNQYKITPKVREKKKMKYECTHTIKCNIKINLNFNTEIKTSTRERKSDKINTST